MAKSALAVCHSKHLRPKKSIELNTIAGGPGWYSVLRVDGTSYPKFGGLYMVVDQYSFILEWPFIAEKKISFADLSRPHREAWSYNHV